MHAEPTAPHPIPDLPPVLADERAAEVATRSVSWVRKRRRVGQLVAAELDGRPAVETKSLLRLMSRRGAPRSRPPIRPPFVVHHGRSPAVMGFPITPLDRRHLRIASVDGRAVPHP